MSILGWAAVPGNSRDAKQESWAGPTALQIIAGITAADAWSAWSCHSLAGLWLSHLLSTCRTAGGSQSPSAGFCRPSPGTRTPPRISLAGKWSASTAPTGPNRRAVIFPLLSLPRNSHKPCLKFGFVFSPLRLSLISRPYVHSQLLKQSTPSFTPPPEGLVLGFSLLWLRGALLR